MRSFLNFSIVALALAKSALAQPDPRPSRQDDDSRSEERRTFLDMVDALPEESLEVALHSGLISNYRDGVFERERNAVEAVLDRDPPLATKLVTLAKLDLVKRQNPNTNASEETTRESPASTPEVTVTETESEQTPDPPARSALETTAIPTSRQPSVTNDTPASPRPSPTPTETTDPDDDDRNPNPNPNPEPEPQPEPEPEPDTTPEPEPEPEQDTNPRPEQEQDRETDRDTDTETDSDTPVTPIVVPVVITTTEDGGRVVFSTTSRLSTPSQATNRSPAPTRVAPVDVTTTDASGATVVLADVTPGEVVTTTNARGSTVTLTYTPGGSRISSLVLRTTTLPNGSQSTITSYQIIAATQSGGTNTVENAPSDVNTAEPGLQTNAAVAVSRQRVAERAAAVVGGALAGAALLL